jgi:hypothetical protein
MAFTHSVPSGSTNAAAPSSSDERVAAMAMPAATPRISAARPATAGEPPVARRRSGDGARGPVAGEGARSVGRVMPGF